MSVGNRSPTGAETHGILASLAQTARQNGQDFVRAAVAVAIYRQRDPAFIAPVLPVLA